MGRSYVGSPLRGALQALSDKRRYLPERADGGAHSRVVALLPTATGLREVTQPGGG